MPLQGLPKLLTALVEETYNDVEHELKEFEGLQIRVATPATLYRMKKDTVRWKDKFDAQALRERFGLED